MPFITRLAYWSAVIVSIAVVANLMLWACGVFRRGGANHLLIRIVIASLLTGPVGAALIVVLDALANGDPLSLERVVFRTSFVAIITLAVSFFEEYLRPRSNAPETLTSPIYNAFASLTRLAHSTDGAVPHAALEDPVAKSQDPKPRPLFLRNLNTNVDDRLLSISTQDHYLDVVTEAGETRILKRMSDAIAELEGYPGLKIHRSHWVALDAVEALEKDGRKCFVRLIDGRRLPVSRPNIPTVTSSLEEWSQEPTSV